MFARTYTSILSVIFFLVVFVAASPAPAPWGGGVPTKTITVTATAAPTGGSGGNCNTGPIQCCNQVQAVSPTAKNSIYLFDRGTNSDYTGQCWRSTHDFAQPPWDRRRSLECSRRCRLFSSQRHWHRPEPMQRPPCLLREQQRRKSIYYLTGVSFLTNPH